MTHYTNTNNPIDFPKMNPKSKIQELAIEAGIISAEYNGFDPTGLTKAQRKFAELIVEECIQAIQNESMNSSDEFEHGLRFAEGAILDHFGVKE